MKKILFSVGVIAFVSAVALGATGAFFSDSETSTGNTFTAGDIDLQIDNESYVTNANGVLVASPNTSWELKDLIPGVDHFFNFRDLKPGDLGEDTISIHVGSNNAWMCAAARITDNSDQTCTDPERADDSTCTDPNGEGELASQLNFTFWHDDGDNVLETDEYNGGAGVFLSGPLSGIDQQGKITLADSDSSILGSNTPIPGGTTFYIGKAWCFGTLTPTPVTPGDYSELGPLTPEVGTGFTCNGSQVNNAAQTDRVQGDLQFYAVQARNNPTFSCAAGYDPVWPEDTTVVVRGNDLETNLLNAPTTGKWYFYDDTADVLNNSLGSFVAGPLTPPLGSGSAMFNPLVNASSRSVLANSQFGGTLLSAISNLTFSEYSPSGAWSVSEAPFLRFNVDFSNSAAYQNSLVYVPSTNGIVTQNNWQTWDLVQPGSLWVYSGATWPAPINLPGTTPQTWSTIVSSYPGIRMHPGFPFIGVRAGEPGPTGYNANVDKFSITISGITKTFDFEN